MSVQLSTLVSLASGRGEGAKVARQWLRDFEQSYFRLEETRRAVEDVMRFEGDNEGRGTVDRSPSSVNATEVRVTARPRVQANRPWIESQSLDDSRYSSRAPRHFKAQFDTTATSRTVPVWFLSVLDSLDMDTKRLVLDSLSSRVLDVVDTRTRPETARQAKAVSHQEVHQAALRSIAGVIRMADQD